MKGLNRGIAILGLAALGLSGFLAGSGPVLAESGSAASSNPCRLILPDIIPVVAGREINIYFDNVILTTNWRNYAFDIECARGVQQEERWTFMPKPEDVGDYPLTLSVYNEANKLVASARTTIHVVPSDAAGGRKITGLFIGDSHTHPSIYTGELLNLCKVPGNPELSLIGTCCMPGTAPENRHEGYGGWTYERFASFYSDITDRNDYKRMCSPFVFMEDGKPAFNIKRYFKEQNGGVLPDFVCIGLGPNDVFKCTDDNIDATLDSVLTYADKLVDGIRKAVPNVKVGLIMSIPPAASQDAFGNNYGCGQTRWQYRRNHHRYIERLKQKYGGREKEGIYLVPSYVNMDCVYSFPAQNSPANARTTAIKSRMSNGTHPAGPGYMQMADSIYNWIKATYAGNK